jgi:diadenosine tetraphosphatase ApaH/serine/threonine PP2A family protein phosphatase
VDARAHQPPLEGFHARATVRPALRAGQQPRPTRTRSPRKVNEYLFEDKSTRTFERIAAGADCNVLVFGHTHRPWIQEYGGVVFVNCGSVGKPKDGEPRAAYALLELGGDPVVAGIERVDYDAEAVAREVTAAGLPGEYADKLLLAA